MPLCARKASGVSRPVARRQTVRLYHGGSSRLEFTGFGGASVERMTVKSITRLDSDLELTAATVSHTGGTENGWSLPQAVIVRLNKTTSSSLTINGILPQDVGVGRRFFYLIRVDDGLAEGVVTVNHNSGSATTAYRILTPTNAAQGVGIDDIFAFWYDEVSDRWRMIDLRRSSAS